MKTLFIGIALSLISAPSFAQDTTKTVNSKPISMKPANALPNVRFRKLIDPDTDSTKSSLEGNYTIDHYAIQQRNSATTAIIKEVSGTIVSVSKTTIEGAHIENLAFKITETNVISTEDFLYRLFGEVPDQIPADLPVNLKVYKTDNAMCYGIGELSDGTLLIPYKGLLLYLKK